MRLGVAPLDSEGPMDRLAAALALLFPLASGCAASLGTTDDDVDTLDPGETSFALVGSTG